jgi:hypothetical protein
MRTSRTLEAECRQVLRGNVCTGTKEDESTTGHVWAAGFHHVTARSRGETWIRGQRKMSQVMGTFGLLDFTMLRPVLTWRAF